MSGFIWGERAAHYRNYFGKSLWQDFGVERQSSQNGPHLEQPPSANPRAMTAAMIEILFMAGICLFSRWSARPGKTLRFSKLKTSRIV
jgi:hypothetical protein